MSVFAGNPRRGLGGILASGALLTGALALPGPAAAQGAPEPTAARELAVGAGYCAIYKALTNRIPRECLAGGSQARAGAPVGQPRAIVPRAPVVPPTPTGPAVPALPSLPAAPTASGGIEVATLGRPGLGPTRHATPRRPLKYGRAAVPPNGVAPGDAAYFIHFAFNSARIGPDYRAHLDQLSQVLKTGLMENACLKVVGHTDAVGSSTYNQRLSQQRAGTVRSYLVSHGGVPVHRIVVEGMGESTPLPDVDPQHPRNRRVEFRVKTGANACG